MLAANVLQTDVFTSTCQTYRTDICTNIAVTLHVCDLTFISGDAGGVRRLASQ